MFKDKYKKDNDMIKPSEEVLASLTKKMEQFVIDEENGLDPQIKKLKPKRNFTKPLSIAAGFVCIISVSLFTLYNLGDHSNKSNNQMNMGEESAQMPQESSDAVMEDAGESKYYGISEDTADENKDMQDTAESTLTETEEEAKSNEIAKTQDSSDSDIQYKTSTEESPLDMDVKSASYELYSNWMYTEIAPIELEVNESLLNFIKELRSSTLYMLNKDEMETFYNEENAWYVIHLTYENEGSSTMVLYNDGIIQLRGTDYFYDIDPDIIKDFIKDFA